MTSHHPWSAQDQQNNFEGGATWAHMCVVGWCVEGKGEREIGVAEATPGVISAWKLAGPRLHNTFVWIQTLCGLSKGRICVAAATNTFFTWSQEGLSPGNADDEEVVDASLGMVDGISCKVGTATLVSRCLAYYRQISDQTSLPRDTQNKRRLQPDATDLAHENCGSPATSLCNSVPLQMQRRHANPKQQFFVSSPHLPSSCIASQMPIATRTSMVPP